MISCLCRFGYLAGWGLNFSTLSSLICLISCWKAGEENPRVHLSVVSLNGPLHTVVMKKPDDPRIGWVTAWPRLTVYEAAAKTGCTFCVSERVCRWCAVSVWCFQEGVLHHHGDMGHQHQTGCQLAEQSSEQLDNDAVRGYDRRLH